MMMKQLASRGFLAIISGSKQVHAALGAAGARELPGQVGVPALTAPRSEGADFPAISSSEFSFGLQLLPPKSTARLEIWRLCATAATATPSAQRPMVFFASVSSKKGSSTGRKVTSRSAGAKKTTRAKKKASSSRASSSRASGTARGRAAVKHTPRSSAAVMKKAREQAKAKVAAAVAKEKARLEKLKALLEEAKAKAADNKAAAIAKVKAEAEAKLKAAVQKTEAKAAKEIARAEAKAAKARPRRLLSGNNIYVREQIKANPELKFIEVQKRYRELSAEERQNYVDRAAVANAEAREEAERLKAERAARRGLNAYLLFLGDKRAAVSAANPGMTPTAMIRRLGEMWRATSPEERQRYVDMAAADRKAKGLPPLAGPAAAPATVASASSNASTHTPRPAAQA